MSRLIDADALEPDADYDDGDYWAVSIAQIRRAPTIEKRKTGKWIDGYKRQTCSVCKQRGYRSWSFCPNCGAKMEAET